MYALADKLWAQGGRNVSKQESAPKKAFTQENKAVLLDINLPKKKKLVKIPKLWSRD